MLPLHEEAAQKLASSFNVFLLYSDGTEGIAVSQESIHNHAEKGGIFAVEKEDWLKHLEREIPEQAIEGAASQDRGEVGRKPVQEKTADKDGKTSILDRLKTGKAEKANKNVAPQRGRKDDRDR